jgi:hypothetical protein
VEATIAGILGAVVGALASGYFALRAAQGQIEAMMQQVRGSVSDRLYETNRTLLEYLGNYPALRPYFYDNRPLADCREDDRNRAMVIAGMFGDLMELVVLDLNQLSESVRDRWAQFVSDTYAASPAVREYLSQFGHWYSPKLLDLVRKDRPSQTAVPAASVC